MLSPVTQTRILELRNRKIGTMCAECIAPKIMLVYGFSQGVTRALRANGEGIWTLA
jgi:hypothetical protein